MTRAVACRSEVLEILAKLIAFPTTCRDSNLGLIEWTRDQLGRQGIESRLVYDRDGRKANLLATIGPPDRAGILVSGHTDVVAVDGQDWHSDPFVATLRDDRVYGRGACDMKGFLAAVLDQVPRWAESNLASPIHLALSYDEEMGCLGVPGLLEAIRDADLRVMGCIVGEPTRMVPVVAHKGSLRYRCRVHGKAAHSSLAPFGVNAIEYAARLIDFIRTMAEHERQFGLRDAGFPVPHSTLSTTLVHGGLAANVIPESCEFTFGVRYLPGVRPEEILEKLHQFRQTLVEEMRRGDPDCNIELSRLPGECYPLQCSDQAEILRLVRQLTDGQRTAKVDFGSEAGHFQRAGMAAVLCGPGSMEHAHKPDEFVGLEDLAACSAFLERLGEWCVRHR